MPVSRWHIIVAAWVALASETSVAAEKVGEAVLIRTSVTGQNGALATHSPVHRDERIRTSKSGLGEFLFRDGTRFAVGWNSTVTIDKFVFDDSRTVQNLTIKAAKGSFRWISGGSSSSAYKINTPAGTIGIRGTAFDFYVGANGTTAVVLFNGSAQFCGRNGCRTLNRRCDVIIATRAGGVQDPRRLDQKALRDLGTQRALPFISGGQALSGRFRVPGSGCLHAANRTGSKTPASRSAPAAAPDPPGSPEPPGTPGPSAPGPGKGHPNNGKGNGGGDRSPNGRSDVGR